MTSAFASTTQRLPRASVAAGLLIGVLAWGVPQAAAEPVPRTAGEPVDVVHVRQSTVPEGVRHPLHLKVVGRTPTAEPLLVGETGTGFTPAQIRTHLGLTGTGAGQTIAVVSAYDAPHAAADLAVFSRAYGLPAPPSFRKVNQSGGKRLPGVNAGWALETALDLQWAHAFAPDASLLLVEASTNSLRNLMAAVTYAAGQPGVSVISGSWGTPEFVRQKDHNHRCRLPTAVCVFATGDDGNPAAYPATNRAALAVGGTSLRLGPDGTIADESAWSGSGGGISKYSPQPGYQLAVTDAERRATPDVSFVSDPQTGFPVYSSTPYDGQSGWFQMGGTSAAAPQWAGIIAVGNELRRTVGKGPLVATTPDGRTPLHTALYGAAAGLGDITAGTNGTCGVVCTARPGYDTVTGLGSARRGIDVVLRDAA